MLPLTEEEEGWCGCGLGLLVVEEKKTSKNHGGLQQREGRKKRRKVVGAMALAEVDGFSYDGQIDKAISKK